MKKNIKTVWLISIIVIFIPSFIENENLFFSALGAALITLPVGIVIFSLWWLGSIWVEGLLGYEPAVSVIEIVSLSVVFVLVALFQSKYLFPKLKVILNQKNT